MRLYRFTSTDEQQTAALGEILGAMLRAGDILALDGPLGAGKTTLTRAIAAGRGIDRRQISSPTFTIVNEYEAGDGAVGGASGPALIHMDAYRLSGPDDLDGVDWDRLTDPAATAPVVVEWAERIEAALPQGRTARVRLKPEQQTTRRIEILLPQSWPARPEAPRLLELGAEPVQVTSCPITGAPVATDSPTWPFASEQARMADLHRWFAGEYRLSREATEEDQESF